MHRPLDHRRKAAEADRHRRSSMAERRTAHYTADRKPSWLPGARRLISKPVRRAATRRAASASCWRWQGDAILPPRRHGQAPSDHNAQPTAPPPPMQRWAKHFINMIISLLHSHATPADADANIDESAVRHDMMPRRAIYAPSTLLDTRRPSLIAVAKVTLCTLAS